MYYVYDKEYNELLRSETVSKVLSTFMISRHTFRKVLNAREFNNGTCKRVFRESGTGKLIHITEKKINILKLK